MTDTTKTQQLIEELYQDYLRTTASPLPKDPGQLGWQMNTAQALSGFVLALDHLRNADPALAEDVTAWWTREDDENFGPEEGPDPMEFEFWAMDAIAGSPERFEQWAAEAREAAVEAQNATV